MSDEAAKVASKLTKGAAKAVSRMSSEWQFCGKATFDANGAHNAFWQCGGYRDNKVIEREPRKDGKWSRSAYRLTPFGVEVQRVLTPPQSSGDAK